MKIEQSIWHGDRERATHHLQTGLSDQAQLVLVFGNRHCFAQQALLEEINRAYPQATLFGCTTAGEIMQNQVIEGKAVCTAIAFDSSWIKTAQAQLKDPQSSFQAGQEIIASLDKKDLRHVLVLSDGIDINGSELVKGIRTGLPPGINVTGGLAADGEDFEKTLVCLDQKVSSKIVAAVGFYGKRLKTGCGSLGGWDPFGPYRLITKSKGNILYELDGKSALELYKAYLGKHAQGLPATGLLFPLTIQTKQDGPAVVRTILSVNEEEQSMTFAGDVPEGAYARLMKTNFDRLIDGAVNAAKAAALGRDSAPELAILISCVGRKIVLRQRIEEEIEGIRSILGTKSIFTGFYSYGEISPFVKGQSCELHNQTMTITTLMEV